MKLLIILWRKLKIWFFDRDDEKVKWIEAQGIERKCAQEIDLSIKDYVLKKRYREDDVAEKEISEYIDKVIEENRHSSSTDIEAAELNEISHKYLKNEELNVFHGDYVGVLVYVAAIVNMILDLYSEVCTGFDADSPAVYLMSNFGVLLIWGISVNFLFKSKYKDVVAQLNRDATIPVILATMIYYGAKIAMTDGATTECSGGIYVIHTLIITATIFLPIWFTYIKIERRKRTGF